MNTYQFPIINFKNLTLSLLASSIIEQDRIYKLNKIRLFSTNI